MIVVKLTGGLGNQMFQYAFGRVLSIKNKVPLKLDTSFFIREKPRPLISFTLRNFDLDIFNIRAEIATPKEISQLSQYPMRSITDLFFKAENRLNQPIFKKIRGFLEPPYFYRFGFDLFNPKSLEINSSSYLEGQWVSEKYFKEYEKNIREDFTFRAPLLPESRELASYIQNSQSVCLNVRRADFVNNPDTKRFHGLLEVEYFNKAMNLLERQVNRPYYFVFSDDLGWCKENLKSTSPIHFVEHVHAGLKFGNYLQLMTHCKHFIIPNSTFGWWAAWLSQNKNKIVIAPKRWFASSKINTDDVIPENWLKI